MGNLSVEDDSVVGPGGAEGKPGLKLLQQKPR